jgi:hypothetical protein
MEPPTDPKRKVNKPNYKIPQDFVSGDDKCKSCTGIIYFTKGMKDAGDLPLCIGKVNKMDKKIPIDNLEKLDKTTRKMDLGTYISVGYSQSSGRMERTGGVPICVSGFQIHIPNKVVTTGPNSKKENEINNIKNENNYRNFLLNDADNIKLDKDNIIASVDKIYNLMLKGTEKQYNRMTNFYNKKSEKFPEKFSNTFNKLYQSSSTNAVKIKSMLNNKWDNIWK